MEHPFRARCGLDCEACSYHTPTGCPGCRASDGTMAWGECEVAKCCIAGGHTDCGFCADFPCPTLNKYAYDPEHGNGGERLRNLRAWHREAR